MNDLLIITTAICDSASAQIMGYVNRDPTAHAMLVSKAFNTKVGLPVGGALDIALHGGVPPSIQIWIMPEPPMAGPRLPLQHQTLGFQRTVTSLFASQFVLFYEEAKAALPSHLANAVEYWPAAMNFARVIRNAIAHNGEIHFSNLKAPSVEWHHLRLSPVDNGRQWTAGDFWIAELIILMFEANDALENLLH